MSFARVWIAAAAVTAFLVSVSCASSMPSTTQLPVSLQELHGNSLVSWLKRLAVMTAKKVTERTVHSSHLRRTAAPA